MNWCHMAYEYEENMNIEFDVDFEHHDLLAQKLLMHAVSYVLDGCGNSYINSYVEEWLKNAKKLGAYHGKTTGNVREINNDWNEWLDNNGGLTSLS